MSEIHSDVVETSNRKIVEFVTQERAQSQQLDDPSGKLHLYQAEGQTMSRTIQDLSRPRREPCGQHTPRRAPELHHWRDRARAEADRCKT